MQAPASNQSKDHQELVRSNIEKSQRPDSSTWNPMSQLPAGEKDQSRQSSIRLLLVEDNLINQKVLGKQLTKAGCVVHVANDGQEALNFLQKSALWKGNSGGHSLDIVLMDLEMPVMDGITCSRRIRELEAKGTIIKHVPLIAVTANVRKEQIETTVSAGMVCVNGHQNHFRPKDLMNSVPQQDDFMPKPFRVAELLPKMKQLMKTTIGSQVTGR